MAIITLITDFGIEDEYVGLLKGVILRIDPAALVVDVTHAIKPQDVAQAAFALEASFRYYPEGTIHFEDVCARGAGCAAGADRQPRVS